MDAQERKEQLNLLNLSEVVWTRVLIKSHSLYEKAHWFQLVWSGCSPLLTSINCNFADNPFVFPPILLHIKTCTIICFFFYQYVCSLHI